MDTEAVKREILEVLKVFDGFCKAHDIKYMLAYGTLIGAVRHKGFIPWDDDIDVIMTVDEYRRLKEMLPADRYLDENKRYRFAVPGDENYAYSFMKVIDTKYTVAEKNIADNYFMGLYIDIFRADHWPKGRVREFIQLKREHFLLQLNKICVRGNISEGSRFALMDKLLRPVDLLFRLFGITSSRICRRMDRLSISNPPSGFMGSISEGTGWKREKMPAEVYTEYCTVTFEGGEYPAPKNYDRVLTSIYGDYMKLPDPSQRKGHEFNIISTDERF